MQIIDARQACQKCQEGAVLVDIREVLEYRRERINEAISLPLTQLEQGLPGNVKGKCVIFHCKAGMRTQNASAELATLLQQNGCEGFILKDGIEGWKQAGLETIVDKSQPIDLMRQVQIAAGSLVLLGTILGSTVSSGFYLLSAFVGAGLLFAGISGFCGLARLLAKMPWNQR